METKALLTKPRETFCKLEDSLLRRNLEVFLSEPLEVGLKERANRALGALLLISFVPFVIGAVLGPAWLIYFSFSSGSNSSTLQARLTLIGTRTYYRRPRPWIRPPSCLRLH